MLFLTVSLFVLVLYETEAASTTCKSNNAGCGDFCTCAKRLLPKSDFDVKKLWQAYTECNENSDYDYYFEEFVEMFEDPDYKQFCECLVPGCQCKKDILGLLGVVSAARKKRGVGLREKRAVSAEVELDQKTHDECMAKKLGKSVDAFREFEKQLEEAECNMIDECYKTKCGKTHRTLMREVRACMKPLVLLFTAEQFVGHCRPDMFY